jgi:hypothetical protein
MLALIGCALLILCCLLVMAVATLLMATELLDNLNWRLFGPSVESAGTGHSNSAGDQPVLRLCRSRFHALKFGTQPLFLFSHGRFDFSFELVKANRKLLLEALA